MVSFDEIEHLPVDFTIKDKKSVLVEKFDLAEIELFFCCAREEDGNRILVPEGIEVPYYIFARTPGRDDHSIFGLPYEEAIIYEKDGYSLCLVNPLEINLSDINIYNLLKSSFKRI